jgi:translocator protein
MANFNKQQQIAGFIGWFALTFIAAALGSAASIQAKSFYAELVLPAWAPPGSVFGPVWTTLYVMMAVASWLVWRADGFLAARPALFLYVVQLVLNALWSWLFFAWKLGALAFVDILLLLILIGVTLVAFFRIRPVAGVLLVPYLCWVGFASVLNFTVWQLNPELLG